MRRKFFKPESHHYKRVEGLIQYLEENKLAMDLDAGIIYVDGVRCRLVDAEDCLEYVYELPYGCEYRLEYLGE